jgi:hypothetical protein
MHFGKNSGPPERRTIDERVLDGIRRIVLRMEQERWRRLGGDVIIWIQLEISLWDGQVPRVERYRKIRAATFFVSGVHGWIETPFKLSAHRGDHVTACREAEYADLVRIDMPVGCVEAQQSHRSLGILQRRQAIPVRP